MFLAAVAELRHRDAQQRDGHQARSRWRAEHHLDNRAKQMAKPSKKRAQEEAIDAPRRERYPAVIRATAQHNYFDINQLSITHQTLQAAACYAARDDKGLAMPEKSDQLYAEAEERQTAAKTTEQQTYAERLRVAHDIVEHLRSAGVTCDILNGVQPGQCSRRTPKSTGFERKPCAPASIARFLMPSSAAPLIKIIGMRSPSAASRPVPLDRSYPAYACRGSSMWCCV